MTKPACNHINPATWIHRAGNAWCPSCGKYLGRLDPNGTPRRRQLTRENEPASDPAESDED